MITAADRRVVVVKSMEGDGGTIQMNGTDTVGQIIEFDKKVRNGVAGRAYVIYQWMKVLEHCNILYEGFVEYPNVKENQRLFRPYHLT